MTPIVDAIIDIVRQFYEDHYEPVTKVVLPRPLLTDLFQELGADLFQGLGADLFQGLGGKLTTTYPRLVQVNTAIGSVDVVSDDAHVSSVEMISDRYSFCANFATDPPAPLYKLLADEKILVAPASLFSGGGAPYRPDSFNVTAVELVLDLFTCVYVTNAGALWSYRSLEEVVTRSGSTSFYVYKSGLGKVCIKEAGGIMIDDLGIPNHIVPPRGSFIGDHITVAHDLSELGHKPAKLDNKLVDALKRRKQRAIW